MSTPVIPIRRTRAPRANILLRVALLGSLALAAAGVAVWLLASGSSSGAVERQGPSAAAIGAFEEKTGVQLVRVALTGGSGIIDLRYRVIDPDKGLVVHDPDKRPAIVDEATGGVIGDPFMGMWMHSKSIKPGVVYYQLFVNRQRLIKPGGRVSVRLGGVVLRDVLVE